MPEKQIVLKNCRIVDPHDITTYLDRDGFKALERAKETIIRSRPKLVVFGASLIAFPHPVQDLAGVARESGATVGFDGSHVMGLVGGGKFQDPLREGASALFGSTHKTLFGPQGGIILADKQHGELMRSRVYPAIVDNAHWNRIAALTLALAELREFGEDYAKQVIDNSQALAHALSDLGFPVVCPHLGFTKSHQAILDYGGFEQGRIIAERLERVNIIVDCGVRVGTCEVTRRGMKEEEMMRMAQMMKNAIASNAKLETVRKEVIKMCQEFPRVEYCFQD